jgi:hypothetical protein
MREQLKKHWVAVEKRKWVKPAVSEFALDDDILRLFKSKYSTDLEVGALAAKRSAE